MIHYIFQYKSEKIEQLFRLVIITSPIKAYTQHTSFFLSFLSFPTMSNLTFRANTCDHMIYDGACECNERRVDGEPDFLTTFMEEVAEVVPRSLFRDPDGPAEIVEYDQRPTEMDLAILGSMAFCGIRTRHRHEAGIESSETDSLELTASMNVAKNNPTLLHSTPEFLSLFNSEMNKMKSEQAQAQAHLEDERLMDEAEEARLREYENDVAEDAAQTNDGDSCASDTEDQAYLDACDAMSYNYEDRIGSPDYANHSSYYEQDYNCYDGDDY